MRIDRIGQVFVTNGKQTVVLLSDRLVDLREVDANEVVSTKGHRIAEDMTFDVLEFHKGNTHAVEI